MSKKRLTESTPAEQAHALGLTYGGYGGWVDKNRKKVAQTVDGKLVKIKPSDDEEDQTDLGKLIVFDFDAGTMDKNHNVQKDTAPRFMYKYRQLLMALRDKGVDMVYIIPRGSERGVADYLASIGMDSGPKMVNLPPMDPNARRDLVAQKIKEGYTNIHYFGQREEDNAAVESLRATYNKVKGLRIKTHFLTGKTRT